MRRYWVEDSAVNDGQVLIEGDTYKHIVGVCRMSEGSHFEVLVSGGKAFFVEMLDVQKKVAIAKILEERQIPPLRKPFIHLVQSVPKFQVLENLIEKSVELGVYDIHLVTTEYSFMKEKTSVFDKKMDRWNKIVKSSTQQSGRGSLMEIHKPVSLSEFLKSREFIHHQLPIFAYEGEARSKLHEVFPSDVSDLTDVWVFVGPEGGFSLDEVQGIRSRGVEPVSLGDQVLRVETAAVSLIAAVKYQLHLF